MAADLNSPLLISSEHSLSGVSINIDSPGASRASLLSLTRANTSNERTFKLTIDGNAASMAADDKEYPRNVIVTSKYTVFNFLPKALLEQFRRLANVYFLIIGIIAAIGMYTKAYQTAIDPSAVLVPMSIVISISMSKEFFEDYTRHKTDSLLNSRLCKVLVDSSGKIESRQRRDLVVGSVVLLRDGDEVPADVVPLLAGGVQGSAVCYVETSAIDGESNLKPKGTILPSMFDAVAGVTREGESTDSNKTIGKNSDDSDVLSIEGNQIVNLSLYLQKRGIKLGGLRVTCEGPNYFIHAFNGSAEARGSAAPPSSTGGMCAIPPQQPLGEANLLLRGSFLKATEWAVAVVAYTGQDTKLSLNSKAVPSKLSAIDRVVNQALIVAITVLLLLCIASMILSISWQYHNPHADYLCLQASDLSARYPSGGCENGATTSVLTILTFATLYNNMVCISMYVSLEVVYLLQTFFISSDINLYDPSTNCRCEVHTSSLCADVGQIQYVLSDKTGTLTKNVMCVRQVALSGCVLGLPVGAPLAQLQELSSQQPTAATFLLCMAACNTCLLMPCADEAPAGRVAVTDFESLQRVLTGESPDEVALVLAAAEHGGAVLSRRAEKSLTIRSLGTGHPSKDSDYEILAVNTFDSNRKRMSIVLRELGSKRLLLLCKGADSAVISQCDQRADMAATDDTVRAFALTGLRTLVLAWRELTAQECFGWMNDFRAASSSIANRASLLAKCAAKIEVQLQLLGVVGIEDELQEGVPEAVTLLKNMGLNVWLLTGDKPETAMAIARMSNLLGESSRVERVLHLFGEELQQRVCDLYACCPSAGEEVKNPLASNNYAFASSTSRAKERGPGLAGELALVIDDVSLEGIRIHPILSAKFAHVIRSAPVVIACRVSPLQKASIVRMVKTSKERPVTLAIGDGANDVAMIHEARVGVGICGREGRHAANNADFAISQFRHLPTLLLDHGRLNYMRCCKLVLYSFFKNLLLVSTLFYYNLLAGVSGTIPVDSLVFAGYNFYLGLPILVTGVLEIDVSKEDARLHPRLAYAFGRLQEGLRMRTVAAWSVAAFAQGFVLCVLVVRYIAGPRDYDYKGIGFKNGQGQDGGIFSDGFCLFTCCVLSQSYKVISMSRHKPLLLWGMLALSLVGYFAGCLLYCLIPSIGLFYFVPVIALSMPSVWLCLLLLPLLLLVLDVFMFDFVLESSCLGSSSTRLTQLLKLRRRALAAGCAADGVAYRQDRYGIKSFLLRVFPAAARSATPAASPLQPPQSTVFI